VVAVVVAVVRVEMAEMVGRLRVDREHHTLHPSTIVPTVVVTMADTVAVVGVEEPVDMV